MQWAVERGNRTAARAVTALSGAGMMAAAALSIQVWYAASYPAVQRSVGWCVGGPLFNCDAAALSAVGAVAGVPIGWFGLVVGASLVLGALLPAVPLERTNRGLAVVNAVAVILLFFHATLVLRTLCLLCTAYGGFSLVAAAVLLRWRDGEPGWTLAPTPLHLAVLAAIAAGGGWSLAQYRTALHTIDEGVAGVEAVSLFYSLPPVPWPGEISPYRPLQATAEFEAAPIRIVAWADALCIDCRVFHEQLRQLEAEFAGRINLAYQFFPLEAACNDVVDKDKHPGSCELAYMAAYDPARFRAIHDEIYDNQDAARDRGWQLDLARRHGVEAALTDTALQARVHRLIRTGTEYAPTSERYSHGIRSTPTIIINNRMIIGTMPTAQLRAIFRALVREHDNAGAGFLERWLDPGCVIADPAAPPQPCGG